MKKPRKMEEIIKDMEKLPTKPDESAHMIADALLIEALRRLAVTNYQKNEVEWLIGAYERIEKWYP